MTWYYAIILGLVQGLTEFLPVSSSGHLVLFSHILNVPQAPEFDLFLHLGTLGSVCFFYKKELFSLLKPPYKRVLHLFLATLPAVIIALFFKEQIMGAFTISFLPIGFIITAALLVISDILPKGNREPSAFSSFSSGVFQAVATLPGISRSASTTFGSLILGIEREKAVDFAFLTSIPVILGGAVFSVPDLLSSSIDLIPAVLGVLTSFLTGLASIKLTLLLFKKNKARYFAYYLLLVALAIVIL